MQHCKLKYPANTHGVLCCIILYKLMYVVKWLFSLISRISRVHRILNVRFLRFKVMLLPIHSVGGLPSKCLKKYSVFVFHINFGSEQTAAIGEFIIVAVYRRSNFWQFPKIYYPQVCKNNLSLQFLAHYTPS